MFAINVLLTVREVNDIPQVRRLLGECGRLSRAEPGCLGLEVCHSEADPRLFILVERWESESAWQEHRTREAVQTIYLPQVIPLVDRVPHISTIVE